jgi:hypothetical protein
MYHTYLSLLIRATSKSMFGCAGLAIVHSSLVAIVKHY